MSYFPQRDETLQQSVSIPDFCYLNSRCCRTSRSIRTDQNALTHHIIFIWLSSVSRQEKHFDSKRSRFKRPWGHSHKNTHTHTPPRSPKEMNKKIMQADIAGREREIESKWGRGRSMTRSETGEEPAVLEKSCRKVIFNPRLENNFTFPQISLKNLLLSEPGRFIQINGL